MLLFGIMFHSLSMSFHEAGTCSDQFWDFMVRIELSFCKQITCHANGLLCKQIISWNLFELEFYSTNSEKSSIFCLLWIISKGIIHVAVSDDEKQCDLKHPSRISGFHIFLLILKETPVDFFPQEERKLLCNIFNHWKQNVSIFSSFLFLLRLLFLKALFNTILCSKLGVFRLK